MLRLHKKSSNPRRQEGQALVEYVLILALMALAMAVALAATGPAIADVFSTVICTVAGQNPCGTDRPTLSTYGDPNAFWQTVTWVAQNPQLETPFPTPPIRPPTLEPTSGSALETNTPSPSETPIPSATLGPSATPRDRAFYVPFYDPADDSSNWRLDASVYVGGDDWEGRYYQNNSFSGTPIVLSNAGIPGVNPLNINFNWGTGAPIAQAGWTATDNFSVKWVRQIDVQAPGENLRFTLNADDRASLYLCPTEAATANPGGCNVLLNNTGSGSAVQNVNGSAWLVLTYIDYTGTANVRLDITGAGGVNVDDTTTAECTWGLKAGADTNTLYSMFDENPNSDTWPANQTCYLELRGWVDIGGTARPILNFWDVWDLPAGATASVQVADYSDNRALLNWRNIPLRAGGANVRNYEWTRSAVNLRTGLSPALTSERVAIRFVLSSTGGPLNPARWYLDDFSITDQPVDSFTVNDFWDLNNPAQRDDFIATGRWDLTRTRTHGGAGFEDSPQRDGTSNPLNYDRHSQGGPRIHYIELAQPINLQGAPATDYEDDDGVPMFSFWHAYQIAPGTRLEVQYTRDAHDTTVDTWTVIPDGPGTPPLQGGLLANNTTTGTDSQLIMRPVYIKLDQIPNYNTQPFRLRLALIIPDGGATADGWWFDDLRIERDGGLRYTAFPFIDGAEDDTFIERQWLRMGTWAVNFTTGVREGAFVTGRSYSDSPNGSYLANTNTSMEMKRYIDLFYDTPRNTTNPGTIGEPTPTNLVLRQAVTRPMLSFWHRRDLQAGSRFSVEMTTALLADNNPNSDAEWREIWFYVTPGSNPTLSADRWTQNAWERVEIDLAQALATVGGVNWATLRANTERQDDDIRIRFRLVTGSSTDDGITVDGIRLINDPELVHRLWGSAPVAGSVAATLGLGAGDGNRYEDFIESAFPTALSNVSDRWYLGAWSEQVETGSSGDVARSGALALADTPQDSVNSPIQYQNETYSILEMRSIIDLRGVTAAEVPTLYYWQRYQIGDNTDRFRVEISVEDSAQTASQRGLIPGWSAWTEQNPRPYTAMDGSSHHRVGWQRQLADLSSFVGKRIKVRWVINAMNTGGQGDGWYIDNISFAYNLLGGGRNVAFTLPFVDAAQGTTNWIMEGNWGLTSQYFRPDAAQNELLNSVWQGYWFNATDIQSAGRNPWSATDSMAAVQSFWPRPAAGTTNIGTPTRGLSTSDVTPLINTLLDIWVPAEGPLNGALGLEYRENVVARYMRVVTLQPGTYVFHYSFDDALRIWINDRTNTSVTNSNNNILDCTGGGCWMQRDRVSTTFLTVTQPITRVIGVDFYQTKVVPNTAPGRNPGHVFVNLGREAYSFTDSPNTLATGGYTTVNALRPGVTSMISNGYFNLSGLANPTVDFYWIGDLRNSISINLEFSVDGGFTWTSIWNTGNWRNFDPDWSRVTLDLSTIGSYSGLTAAQKARTMFRFRLQNFSGDRDGVYIGDIQIFTP